MHQIRYFEQTSRSNDKLKQIKEAREVIELAIDKPATVHFHREHQVWDIADAFVTYVVEETILYSRQILTDDRISGGVSNPMFTSAPLQNVYKRCFSCVRALRRAQISTKYSIFEESLGEKNTQRPLKK